MVQHAMDFLQWENIANLFWGNKKTSMVVRVFPKSINQCDLSPTLKEQQITITKGQFWDNKQWDHSLNADARLTNAFPPRELQSMRSFFSPKGRVKCTSRKRKKNCHTIENQHGDYMAKSKSGELQRQHGDYKVMMSAKPWRQREATRP